MAKVMQSTIGAVEAGGRLLRPRWRTAHSHSSFSRWMTRPNCHQSANHCSPSSTQLSSSSPSWTEKTSHAACQHWAARTDPTCLCRGPYRCCRPSRGGHEGWESPRASEPGPRNPAAHTRTERSPHQRGVPTLWRSVERDCAGNAVQGLAQLGYPTQGVRAGSVGQNGQHRVGLAECADPSAASMRQVPRPTHLVRWCRCGGERLARGDEVGGRYEGRRTGAAESPRAVK